MPWQISQVWESLQKLFLIDGCIILLHLFEKVIQFKDYSDWCWDMIEEVYYLQLYVCWGF